MPRAARAEQPASGLTFRSSFVTVAEERGLVAVLEGIDYRQVVLRGRTARRTVRHFGLDYDYTSHRLTPTEPLPAPLVPMRDRAAALAGVVPEDLAQILVTRYEPGAAIGWHRDAPTFGLVVGVSFQAACRMRLREGQGDERRVHELELPPRSAYVLAGEARTAWQHSIPAVEALRYSITFRTLRGPEQRTGRGGRGDAEDA